MSSCLLGKYQICYSLHDIYIVQSQQPIMMFTLGKRKTLILQRHIDYHICYAAGFHFNDCTKTIVFKKNSNNSE